MGAWMRQRHPLLGVAIFGLVTLSCSAIRADETWFETRIRPVLAEHCFTCHASSEADRGLRLDRPDGFRTDDGQGLVVVPGDPESSRLIHAIERRASVAPMPPEQPLSDSQIADIRKWVADGAPWPDGKSLLEHSGSSTAAEQRKNHWAFQPPRRIPSPRSQNERWNRNFIDRWIDSERRVAGLSASPQATPRELVRRLAFDLTGLPPDSETFEQFSDVDAETPEAMDELIDALLNSDAFGQHWGRHWLDIARYSEIMGMDVEDDARDTNPFAYTYRDWVIEAFSRDVPYNEFIELQLAADHVRPEHHPDLAALGFLTVGNKFEGDEPNQIDDRLDAIFRGLQGITISCARCHDHKYDPIPTREYYALYAVFAEGMEKETPIIRSEADRETLAVYRKKLRDATYALANHQRALRIERFREPHTQMADYMLAASKPETDDPIPDALGWRPDGLHQSIVVRVRQSLSASKSYHHPVLAPWNLLQDTDESEFDAKVQQLAEAYRWYLRSSDGAGEESEGDEEWSEPGIPDSLSTIEPVNARIASAFVARMPSTRTQLAELYGEIFASVASEWLRLQEQSQAEDVDPPESLPDPSDDEVRAQLFGTDPPLGISDEDLADLLEDGPRQHYEQLLEQLVAIKAAPDAPPHARVFVDGNPQREQVVFIRGKQDRPGEQVVPRFLSMLDPDAVDYSLPRSRWDLARSIVDPYNPLTARVWVNRVWLQLFGKGLVETPSDFGARGSTPTHPELLDALTIEFIKDGWSTKALIRKLVATETYRQSSRDRAEAHEVDPENRWLWRMNRKRLSRESIRDSILHAAEQLDLSPGGPSIPIEELDVHPRRTVYFSIHRRQLDPMSLMFDLPSPAMHSPRRHESILPQQALYMLNNPLVVEASRSIAETHWNDEDVDESISALFMRVLHRSPTAEEFEIARAFFERQAMATELEIDIDEETDADAESSIPLPPPARLAQLLLLSNEFMYID